MFNVKNVQCAIQCENGVWEEMKKNLPTDDQKLGDDEFLDYRIMIDIDGNAWSSEFPKVASLGLTIFKVETDYFEYHTKYIVDGVHLQYVKRDLSDLVEKVEAAVQREEDSEAMADAMVNAFDRYIGGGRWEVYSMEVYRWYARLYNGSAPSEVES